MTYDFLDQLSGKPFFEVCGLSAERAEFVFEYVNNLEKLEKDYLKQYKVMKKELTQSEFLYALFVWGEKK